VPNVSYGDRGLFMKKIIFSIVVLVLLVAFSGSLSAVDEVLGSGSIVIFAYIEGDTYFLVNSLDTPSINLLSDEMNPKGSGIDVGSWTLRVDNPPVDQKTFKVVYEYGALESTDEKVKDTIEYIVLEKESEEGKEGLTERENESFLTVSSGGEDSITTISKYLMVRLTSTGLNQAMKAAATDTYQSNITVSLLSE